MEKDFQGKNKQRGLKRFLLSFKYAIQGIIHAYKHEQSLLVHLIGTITIICLGLLLGITNTEWILLVLALSVVLVVEMINSAIEAIVDMVMPQYHPMAKVAKDCAGGATFVLVVITGIISLYIFVPYVITLLT